VAEKREVLETVLASGKIAGRMVVPLSFRNNGTVARILVKEGASVEAGDTIMTLDNSAERNAVAQRANAVNAAAVTLGKLGTTDAAQVQAQLQQAAAQADAAKKQLDRISSLVSSGAASQDELERVRRDHDVALSQQKAAEAAAAAVQGSQKDLLGLQLKQAESALQEANIALSRTVLRAPEPGRIVKIHANAGALVTPAAPVASFLAADTTTHVELQADEDEMYKIRPGQRVIIGIPALPDSTFEGSVRDIIPLVDASRGTITVQCVIGPTTHVFVPDQTVSAQIITGATPAGIALEKRFVVRSGGAASVFVLRGGRAVRRAVSAREVGNALVQIIEGLAEGDTVLFGLSLADKARVGLVEGR
jgi:HlyD family secretion protein